jgi:hypothetical protein
LSRFSIFDRFFFFIPFFRELSLANWACSRKRSIYSKTIYSFTLTALGGSIISALTGALLHPFLFMFRFFFLFVSNFSIFYIFGFEIGRHRAFCASGLRYLVAPCSISCCQSICTIVGHIFQKIHFLNTEWLLTH